MSIRKDTQWGWHGAERPEPRLQDPISALSTIASLSWSSIGRQEAATTKIYLRAQENWFHMPKPSANQIEDGVSKGRTHLLLQSVSTCHQWARVDTPQALHVALNQVSGPTPVCWAGRPGQQPCLEEPQAELWARRRGQVTDAPMFVGAKHNRCILWCRTIENLNIF